MLLKTDKRIRILYADDDPDDHDLFREALLLSGFDTELIVAHNGCETLFQLDAFPPDILILDINMPLKSGKQCLKEIRDNGRYASIPIVIYSTSQDENDIHITRECGADLYIFKPCSFEALVWITELLLVLYSTDRLRSCGRINYVLDNYRTYLSKTEN